MSLLLVCLLAVATLCNAACETTESDYNTCVSAVVNCLDVVNKDVTSDEAICACFDHYKYWDCLDYEDCKDEPFVADHRVLIEDHKCLSEKEPEEETEYHNDWSRWYNYNFFQHWTAGAVNTTGFVWSEMFNDGETQGIIEVENAMTEEEAMEALDAFRENVEAVLEKECQRQVDRAGADFDCSSVSFSYSILEWEGEDNDMFPVAFYFSSAFGLQASFAVLLSLVLYFIF